MIDRDYMTCPEEEIKDIQALMTVYASLAGEAGYPPVWGAD